MDDYVLIVDDDEDARVLLSNIVELFGVATKTAQDGAEALLQIRAEVPNLVLLDLLMPRYDGFSMLSQLRANPATRHIPVIVVTAVAPYQLDQMKLPGVNRVVAKGHFTTASLSLLIADALGVDPPLFGASA